MKKIYWAGDSTVKDNYIDTYPRTGIAQGLRLYLKSDVIIINHAENARSTKNFISEGRLDKLAKEISRGDFLFIEFGHNDWNEDPNRHTKPFGNYKTNLAKMVKTALERDAYPVLITPLYCRFRGSHCRGIKKIRFYLCRADTLVKKHPFLYNSGLV
jgi:lysophospholipase L1-like esterase